jgi:hypothetical protein
MGPKWLKAAAVVVFFALLAVIALHQPLTNTTTHMPGDKVTDYYHFHWNYWWIRHALTHSLSIYETNYVFFPVASSLAYHTMAVFWYPLWALIEPLFGTFTAFNLIFLVAMTLTGAMMYAFLRREGVSRGFALVGGAMLELSPLMFFAVYWSMTSLVAWFWLPVGLLLWRGVADHAASRHRQAVVLSLALGITLWAMILTDLQYPFLLAFIIVPYGLFTLWCSQNHLRLIAYSVLTVSIVLALLWIGGTLPALLSFDRIGLSPTPAERAVSISFPLGYLWHTDEGTSLGAIVIPLLITSVVLWIANGRSSKHGTWLWLLIALPPLILSAGAFIVIGETQITLPYQMLHDLMGGMFRYPERFGAVFVVAAAVFAGKILTHWTANREHWRRILPTALILLVVADSRAFQSIPIQPQPTRYDSYEQMKREAYDYMVLEVPTGGSSGEGIVGIPEYSALQFYGMTHGKRMFNGHISRVNVNHYWWIRTDDALMAWLGQRRFIEPELVTQQLRERIFAHPIGYIVIHANLIDPYAPTLNEIIGYLNSLSDLLCPPTTENDLVIYRTRWHPDGCGSRTPPEVETGVYQIDIGANDEAFVGWGFHPRESIFDISIRWTGEYPQTQIYADLPPGNYEFSLAAQAFNEDRTLHILVNGEALGEAVTITADAFHVYTFDLPASVIGSGENLTITLDYDGWIVPAEIGQSADFRRLTIAVDWIRFSRE